MSDRMPNPVIPAGASIETTPAETPNPTGNPVIADLNETRKRNARVLKKTPANPSPNAQASAALAATPQMTDADRAAINRRVAILASGFKPEAITLAAADAKIFAASKITAKLEAELASSGTAALALAMRDSAYWLLSGDPANKVAPIKADKTAPGRLLAHVRQLPEMKALLPITEKSESGNVVRVVRTTQFDATSRGTWTMAAKAAFLLADKRTGATTGWLEGRKVPDTKFAAHVVWQADPPPAKGGFVRGVCAPANIIRPRVHMGSKASDVKGGVFVAAVTETNSDTTLRLLLGSHIDALFNHWYDGAPLFYEDTVTDVGQQPSGLLAIPRAARVPGAGTGDTGETQRAAIATGDLLGDIIAIADKIRGKRFTQLGEHTKTPEKTIAALFALAALAFEDCVCTAYEFTPPTGALAADMVDLKNAMCLRISDDPDKPQWLDASGNKLRGGTMQTTARSALPKPPAAKEDDKVA